MSYLSSWSGGKDGCFACYQAIRQGLKISHLVNFIAREHQRVRFHGTDPRLIGLQSQAVGIPLLQKDTTWGEYEEAFKEAVRSLMPQGIEGMVFGDIYLDQHLEWVENICADLGIKAVEPLWGRDTAELVDEFIDAGFKAVLISARADVIDKKWMGRLLDRDFIAYLGEKGIDPCGESGEYHTLVVDGPLFNASIAIEPGEILKHEQHWVLDIPQYRLQAKKSPQKDKI